LKSDVFDTTEKWAHLPRLQPCTRDLERLLNS
jgi:hypothetical protein